MTNAELNYVSGLTEGEKQELESLEIAVDELIALHPEIDNGSPSLDVYKEYAALVDKVIALMYVNRRRKKEAAA